jgi:ElaB/YqjD/DUF883 family membrane-anchored ribosome-binding protein
MEEKKNVSPDTKESLLNKAGAAVENVKENVEDKAEELLKKAKESDLAEKAKNKLGDLKEGAKDLVSNVAEKVHDATEKK